MNLAQLFSAATTLSSIATHRSQAAKSLVDHKAALNAHDRARMRLANRAGSQLDPSMARLARYHNKMYEHHKAAIADIESQTFSAPGQWPPGGKKLAWALSRRAERATQLVREKAEGEAREKAHRRAMILHARAADAHCDINEPKHQRLAEVHYGKADVHANNVDPRDWGFAAGRSKVDRLGKKGERYSHKDLLRMGYKIVDTEPFLDHYAKPHPSGGGTHFLMRTKSNGNTWKVEHHPRSIQELYGPVKQRRWPTAGLDRGYEDFAAGRPQAGKKLGATGRLAAIKAAAARRNLPKSTSHVPGASSVSRARGAQTAGSAMGAGNTYLGVGHGLRHTSQAHYAGDPRRTKKNPHLWWLDGGEVKIHEDTAANNLSVGRHEQTHSALGVPDEAPRGRIDHDLKVISVVHTPSTSPLRDKHEMRRVIDHMAQHYPDYQLRGFTHSAREHIRAHQEDVNYNALSLAHLQFASQDKLPGESPQFSGPLSLDAARGWARGVQDHALSSAAAAADASVKRASDLHRKRRSLDTEDNLLDALHKAIDAHDHASMKVSDATKRTYHRKMSIKHIKRARNL